MFGLNDPYDIRARRQFIVSIQYCVFFTTHALLRLELAMLAHRLRCLFVLKNPQIERLRLIDDTP
jgi:hypothetical protein